MGKWGVDLVDLDQDTIVTGKPPSKLKVRVKDFKEDKRLAGTAVVCNQQHANTNTNTLKTPITSSTPTP